MTEGTTDLETAKSTRRPRWTTGAGLFAWLVLACVLAAPARAADDTTRIQAMIDATAVSGGVVEIPAGTHTVGPLIGARNVSLVGAGRESTILRARDDGEAILTVEGTQNRSSLEVDYASRVEGLTFDGAGHTGTTGVRWHGVSYFEVSRSTFSGNTIGVDLAGSLQARIDDTKFLSNRTGISLHAEPLAYFHLPKLPPSRVLISWSTFYFNSWRAIDYSGGQQLLVEDTELGDNGTVGDLTSAPIWVEAWGDPDGPGLVARGLWMEASHGKAGIVLASSESTIRHSITDVWLAYTDAPDAIYVDGSRGPTSVTLVNVATDANNSTRSLTAYGDVSILDQGFDGTVVTIRIVDWPLMAQYAFDGLVVALALLASWLVLRRLRPARDLGLADEGRHVVA